MNREQKVAWFIVVNFTIAIIISLTAFVILYVKVGTPKAFAAIAFLGLCGISGLSPLMFKKDKGAVVRDERDKTICLKAARAGFALSYLFVGLACMLPFSIMEPNATIQVRWLPCIFMGACLTSCYVRSITLLVLYGRSGKNIEAVLETGEIS